MSILLSDTFTAANNTAINGRTPEIGLFSQTLATSKMLSTGATGGIVDIQNNKARFTASDDGFVYDVRQDDCNLIWFCTLPASGQYRGGAVFRVQNPLPFTDISQADFYFYTVRFDLASANIRLIKTTNGVESTIGSDVTMSFTFGNTYKMELRVSNTTYSLYIDDVLKKSETDGSYPKGTYVGVKAGAISGNDFTVDSFQVNSLVSAPVFGGLVVQ